MKIQNRLLTVVETANILHLSTATIRNWVKTGQLPKAADAPLRFDYATVTELNSKLNSAEINRLCKCANKSRSSTFSPGKRSAEPRFRQLINALKPLQTSPQTVAESLYLLTQLLVNKHQHYLVWADRFRHHSSPQLAKVITQYGYADESPEFLGELYQALSRSGEKSKRGAFYTPYNLIRQILSAPAAHPIETVLDPCCGAGHFLLAAALELKIKPENLYGFDIDPLAVKLAQINLLRQFPDLTTCPNIFCVNTLTHPMDKFIHKFDFAASNPPWGANYRRDKDNFPMLKSKESFSRFIVKTLSLLKENGELRFILPESFLNVECHKDIRQYLLQNFAIKSLDLLGCCFRHVYTPAVLLSAVNHRPESKIVIHDIKGAEIALNHKDIIANNGIINPNFSAENRILLQKILKSPHITLKNQALWALGIVTGNNRKYICNTPSEGWSPVWRGSEINEFTFAPPRHYLHFKPEIFQQTAPLSRYLAPEKLVYRFIANRPIVALDTQQRFTLNSANILLPQLPGWSMAEVMIYLNSKVLQFVFLQQYQTRKVLRSQLETLPFPPTPAVELKKLLPLLVENEPPSAELRRQIEAAVLKSYNLTAEDAAYLLAFSV